MLLRTRLVSAIPNTIIALVVDQVKVTCNACFRSKQGCLDPSRVLYEKRAYPQPQDLNELFFET